MNLTARWTGAEIRTMPEISRWGGMVVTMYWRDHARPHFHVRYAEHRAVFSLYVMDFTEGGLPNTQERMIRNWAILNEARLIEDWNLAEQEKPLKKIAPLDR